MYFEKQSPSVREINIDHINQALYMKKLSYVIYVEALGYMRLRTWRLSIFVV